MLQIFIEYCREDTVRSGLSRFLKHSGGQMTILFALAAVPLMIAAGAAIDYIRIDNVRSQMQAAVDGAALAAAMAVDQSNKQRQGLAQTYLTRIS